MQSLPVIASTSKNKYPIKSIGYDISLLLLALNEIILLLLLDLIRRFDNIATTEQQPAEPVTTLKGLIMKNLFLAIAALIALTAIAAIIAATPTRAEKLKAWDICKSMNHCTVSDLSNLAGLIAETRDVSAHERALRIEVLSQ